MFFIVVIVIVVIVFVLLVPCISIYTVIQLRAASPAPTQRRADPPPRLRCLGDLARATYGGATISICDHNDANTV